MLSRLAPSGFALHTHILSRFAPSGFVVRTRILIRFAPSGLALRTRVLCRLAPSSFAFASCSRVLRFVLTKIFEKKKMCVNRFEMF